MKLRADEADIKQYVEEGWWEASKGLADFVRKNAQTNPSGVAYQTQDIQISWNEYFHSVSRQQVKGDQPISQGARW